MAKYYGTYCCGHNGDVNLIGPKEEHLWRLKWEFSRVCPRCRQIQMERVRERQNKKAVKLSREMDLPGLSGTEKQIAWANILRLQFINAVKDLMERRRLEEEEKSEVGSVRDFGLGHHTEAKFWIENRNEEAFFILKQFAQEKKSEENKIPEDILKEIEQEEADLTIVPSNANRTGVVVIYRGNDKVSIEYRKDGAFRDIVKRQNFFWEGKYWCKKITEYTGKSSDRIAEIGNALLAEGFTVRFPTSESRDKAVSGGFELEHTRWVKWHAAKKQFLIQWSGDNGILYHACRKLPNVQWWDGGMIVPLEYYNEVQDFADTMGFRFSESAQENIRIYQKKERSFRHENVKVVKREDIDDQACLRKALKASGTILEDLLDEA